MNNKKLKANFMRLGISLTAFSFLREKREYDRCSDIASILELEIPTYGDLLDKGQNVIFEPPKKWFTYPDGDSLRNFFEMGVYSFFLYLMVLTQKRQKDLNVSGSAKTLRSLFRFEAVPITVIDNYLSHLESREPGEAFNIFLKEILTSLMNSGDELRIIKNPDSVPPHFPDNLLNAIYRLNDDISMCYDDECYWGTIVLCGKLIETLIAYAYLTVFGKDPDEKRIPTKQRLENLKGRDVTFGVKEEKIINIISECRSAAVHGNTEIPNREEALAVGLFTRDLVRRMFHFFETCNANAFKAERFFWIGVGFLRFEAKQTDSSYEFICKSVAELELKIPGHDELLDWKVRNVIHPPDEWFTGPEGNSMKNWFYIGNISYRIFAFMLNHATLLKNERKILEEIFRRERLSIEILCRYVSDLKKGNAEAAWDRFCENSKGALSQNMLQRFTEN
ncbi:MAG: hypothetical protein OXH50_02915 [Gemmatimonadetes bacterium]|nr:hypothetical protein [Gemmatimonadota bacterium]